MKVINRLMGLLCFLCFSGLNVLSSSVPLQIIKQEQDKFFAQRYGKKPSDSFSINTDYSQNVVTPIQVPSDRLPQAQLTPDQISLLQSFGQQFKAPEVKPNPAESFLGWAYEKKGQVDSFMNPPKGERESWFQWVVKAPFRIGAAVLSPISWLKNNVIDPLIYKSVSIPTYKVADKVGDVLRLNLLGITKKQFDDPRNEQLKKSMEDGTAQITHLLSAGVMRASTSYIDNLLGKFSYNVIKLLVPSAPILGPQHFPIKNVNGDEISYITALAGYKDVIVEHIFKRFEVYLPEELRNGKAFECYKAGKHVYGDAKLVFDLANNALGVLSLSYQLTNHACGTGISHPSRLNKALLVLDIVRNCADSYSRVVDRFKLGANASDALKFFNKSLSWFVAVANWICPMRHHLVATVETAKAYSQIDKMMNGVRDYAMQKFKISKADATRVQILISIDPETVNTEKVGRNLHEADMILKKYGTNYMNFVFSLECNSAPEISALYKVFLDKFHLSQDCAQKIIVYLRDSNISCLRNASINCIDQLLSGYKLSRKDLFNDVDVKKVLGIV